MSDFPTEKASLLSDAVRQSILKFLKDSNAAQSPKFREWTQSRMAQVAEFHIKGDTERLQTEGVELPTLAVGMLFINIAPSVDYLLKKHFGDKKTRERKVEALVSAMAISKEFEEVYGELAKDKAPDEFLRTFKIPSPEAIYSGLENFVLVLKSSEFVFDFLGANSMLEVAKAALASCVLSVTGKYHDREVSALTGAALQDFDYDETAHRVWRIRNLQRISESNAGILGTLLLTVNESLTSSTQF